VLEAYFRDNVKSQVLDAEGNYHRIETDATPFRSQQFLYEQAGQWLEDQARSEATVFIPRRGDSESA
jgi:hypothetical protein